MSNNNLTGLPYVVVVRTKSLFTAKYLVNVNLTVIEITM